MFETPPIWKARPPLFISARDRVEEIHKKWVGIVSLIYLTVLSQLLRLHRMFQKELCNDISNVTVWRVLRI
jgi:hypothetical protein